jgi:hypothetical protein
MLAGVNVIWKNAVSGVQTCVPVKSKAVPLHAMEMHGGEKRRGGIAPIHT